MKKILIVDDDADILYVLKQLLTRRGFEVKMHSTGLNVPEVVLAFQPDLILLDILLPGKPGTEICKELKQSHCEIPIILFSAHQQYDLNFLARFGADAFIRKPFDINDLVNTVKLHMN
jgi:two-component system response regulator VicR